MAEYEEVLSRHHGAGITNAVIQTILNLPNVVKADVYFRWNLIQQDPDDNKFVDCAVTTNADYVITHDKHFNVLKLVPFPQVAVASAEAFKEMLAHSVTQR